MKKNISSKTISLVFSIIVVCFLAAFYALAWTEPTIAPPGGNVDAPVNISSDPQYKTGALRLGGLTVDFDSYLAKDGGSVGIGTDVPTEKLTVSGNIVASGSVCANGGTDCIGSKSAGSMPPKLFILNDNSQTAVYECIHDVDLADYCGDGDGCTIRFLMNNKKDASDQVRVVESNIYMEEKGVFSTDNAGTVYGWTRTDGGDRAWITGDGNREEIANPWGWAFIYDYKHTFCGGDNSIYDDPYTFTLMTHPHIRTKMIVYDNGPGGEPQLVQSSQTADIHIWWVNFEGEHEGCRFKTYMSDCLLDHGWYDTAEWSWTKCQNEIENYVLNQCPQYTSVNWPVYNFGDAIE